MLAFACSLLALGGPAQDDSAGRVARLLEEHCAVCHSPGSDEPKARKKWADATDLAATAANTALVVPGAPDESELYLVVDFEDMPPPDSAGTALGSEEKALLARWIQEGAPVSGETRAGQAEAESRDGSVWTSSIVRWVSHFHPLIVHFPVGLLTAAFLAELLSRLRPAWKTEAAVSFCLALGAISAVPSAALGWMLAENLSHHGGELTTHRWLGSITATAAVFIWWASRRWPQRRFLLLLILAGIVGATGHTGGVLSYGAGWLVPPFLG